jgi:Tfp pilus assembly protein PilF
MKYALHSMAIALLCCFPAAHAAGGGGGGSGAESVAADPVIQTAQAAIARKDWDGAQTTLLKALSGNPSYSLRKSAKPDMDLVFKHYAEALRIDPGHRAAHEYVGEAYLVVNELAKAKEHLAALDKLCFFGCEEYSDLKKAIASYEASHPR